jgi:hypothetical protein
MDKTPAQADTLSANKLQLIDLLLKKKGISAPRVQQITRRAERGRGCLSFSQERLWFLNQLDADNPSYNLSTSIRLTGHLSVNVLEQTLNEIIRRHEILRTTFSTVADRPLQFISAPAPLSLPLTDLSTIPSLAERQRQLQLLASAEARLPFDLARGPLLRIRLLRLAAEEHALLLTIHHIVSDGWSIGVFVKEVTTLYEAFSAGQPSPLPELPIQYADFAHWQREWLQGDVLDAQLSYWKEQLAGAPAVLELPTDRPRPAVQSHRGAREEMRMSGEVVEKLRAVSREEGVTLFMTLVGVFQALLWRYSGQEEVVVGTPIANRTRAEVEGLIGFFVNTLVLRTSMSGEPSFREMLKRVKESALGAYAHQDVPFEKLVEELQVERSLKHNPLFQVWFVLQNAPMSELKLTGLTLNQMEFDKGMARHDLKLDLLESPFGLTGTFEYRTELFDAHTIKQIARNFELLLEHVASEPDTTVRRMTELVAEADAQRRMQREKEFMDAPRQRLRDIKLRAMNRAQLKGSEK